MLVMVIAVFVASMATLTVATAVEAPGCQTTDAFCYQPAAEKLVQSIQSVTEPNIAIPSWLGARQ